MYAKRPRTESAGSENTPEVPVRGFFHTESREPDGVRPETRMSVREVEEGGLRSIHSRMLEALFSRRASGRGLLENGGLIPIFPP